MIATLVIIASTSAVSIIAFKNSHLGHRFCFKPYYTVNYYHFEDIIFQAFVHLNFLHLAVNMFVLFLFGTALEQHIGALQFTAFYFVSIIAASAGDLLFFRKDKERTCAGASGAITSVLFAWIVLQPLQKFCLFGYLCLPAYIVGVFYFVDFLLLYFLKSKTINYHSHISGAMFGSIASFIYLSA